MTNQSEIFLAHRKQIFLALFLVILVFAIEYSNIYFYEKSYSYYAILVPVFFYKIFILIQSLIYAKISNDKTIKVSNLVELVIYSIFTILGLLRINHYLPIVNFLFGTGGLLIITSCVLSIFRIKKYLINHLSQLHEQSYVKTKKRFALVGAATTFLYLTVLSILILNSK